MLLHNLISLIVFIKSLLFKTSILYFIILKLSLRYYNYLFNTFFMDELIIIIFLIKI